MPDQQARDALVDQVAAKMAWAVHGREPINGVRYGMKPWDEQPEGGFKEEWRGHARVALDALLAAGYVRLNDSDRPGFRDAYEQGVKDAIAAVEAVNFSDGQQRRDTLAALRRLGGGDDQPVMMLDEFVERWKQAGGPIHFKDEEER